MQFPSALTNRDPQHRRKQSQSEKRKGSEAFWRFMKSLFEPRQLDSSILCSGLEFQENIRLRDAPSFESFGWSWCFYRCYLPVSPSSRAQSCEQWAGMPAFFYLWDLGHQSKTPKDNPSVLLKSHFHPFFPISGFRVLIHFKLVLILRGKCVGNW